MKNTRIENLTITGVDAFDNEKYNGITLCWSANTGFGECTIFREKKGEDAGWKAYTESMCDSSDRTFLVMLLGKLAEVVEIAE